MGGAISLWVVPAGCSFAAGAEKAGQGAAAPGLRFVAAQAWPALQGMGQRQAGRA